MNLPTDFQFSQSNLQDFVDCRRRFQLKHLLHLSWPAVESEPILETERYLELGTRFHHLIHQVALGIPYERLTVRSDDEELLLWWHQFQTAIIENGILHELWQPTAHRFPEISLSGFLANTRLIAKIDLIAVHTDGRIQIFDWKTSQKVPRRQWLADRLQTKVYPYLLHTTGEFLNNGHPINPTQLEMIYWFPSNPDSPIRFKFNEQLLQSNHLYLQSLVETILRLGEDDFPMTRNEERCKFCVYRSLCDRGISAGHLTDLDQSTPDVDESIDIDFNSIDDIVY